MLSECSYAECRYAECRYAECRYAECRYAECRGALNLPIHVKLYIFFQNSCSCQCYKTFSLTLKVRQK